MSFEKNGVRKKDDEEKNEKIARVARPTPQQFKVTSLLSQMNEHACAKHA